MDENYNFEEKGSAYDSTKLTEWDSEDIDDDRIPLGIPEIDQRLNGIPSDSIIAVVTDPRGIGDLFAYHLASVSPTEYVTTVKSKDDIQTGFKRFGPTQEVPPYVRIHETTDTNSIQNALRKEDRKTQNTVIDTFNPLLKAGKRKNLLSEISVSTKNGEGITLVILTVGDRDLTKGEEEILYMCDTVFNVEYEKHGENIDHYLTISRIRGVKDTPEDRLKLDVEDYISVDRTQTG